jgi:hypothetical protein
MPDIAKTEKALALKREKLYAIKSSDTANKELVIKDVDLSQRIVTGFYNTAMYFDSDYDVLLKGSANKSITERGPDSNSVAKIKHLMFHDWTLLPGKIKTLKEDTATVNGQNVTGIYFETKMADTTLGNDTVINYQEGVYDNHSIGFQYLDGEYIDEEAKDWQVWLNQLLNPADAEAAGFMFLWKEIKLFEGSTVAFGANALTPYLGVKSQNKEALALKLSDKVKSLTAQLKNGTQSDKTMYNFEMQLLQLNQIIKELFIVEPDIKDTLPQRRTDDTFNLSEAIKSTKFLI